MIGINLIDESVLAARRKRRRLRQWSIALSAIMAVAAIPVGLERTRQKRVESLRNEKSVLTAQIESNRTKLNAQGIEIRNLKSQVDRANALRTKRSWNQLLGIVAEAMPDQLWLVSVATVPAQPRSGDIDKTLRKKPAGTQTGHTESKREVVTMDAPRALSFDGYALDHRYLYQFMSQLERADVFTDIALAKASDESVLNASAIRFRIECRW